MSKRLMNRIFATAVICLLTLSSCGGQSSQTPDEAGSSKESVSTAMDPQTEESVIGDETETSADTVSTQEVSDDMNQEEYAEVRKLLIDVNGTTLTATLEDNSSAEALVSLIGDGAVTIDAHDFSNFEKVGELPESLPTNDEPLNTDAGDLILYQGNQFVLYYDKNSWTFTKLGHVEDITKEELKELLGNGDVSMTLRMSDPDSEKADVSAGQFNFEKGTVLLNSEYEMPIIGTGMWTLSEEEAEDSTYWALKSGMRLIDTARYYRNETGVGRGLQRAIDEGIVSREDVFITSKIFGGDYERAVEMIDAALADLETDYIDLMLIHQPGADDEGVYKAMEDAIRAGKLRSIGISNYYTNEQVDEVLSFAEITPAVIQNENHIYYQNAELRDYVKQYGIVMESWYPFGGRGHTQENFENEVIQEIAASHGKTAAQVILRWHLQDGYIAIPGSSNPDHIAENYDIFDFELTDEEMERIRAIDKQKRYEPW